MPVISVILPVYNSEKYIYNSVQSILNQSFKDFEFLILDDGSSDNSLPIIKKFTDERIKIFESDRNYGYVFQLNKGLSFAKGKYIARMDADDIAENNRFRVQYDFLENNPGYVLCGTDIKIFFDKNSVIKSWANFVVVGDDEKLRTELLLSCPICHPTVMMRSETLLQNKLQYKQEYITAEDYKMWCELSKYGKLYNINQVLLNYRIQPNQVSQVRQKLQYDTLLKIKEEYRLQFFEGGSKNEMFIQAFNYLINQYQNEKTKKLSFTRTPFLLLYKKLKKKLFLLKR